MSFAELWPAEVWPVIQDDFRNLLRERVATQDTATGIAYGPSLYEKLRTKKEIRNVSCNLTFTDPVANTMLPKDISMDTVVRFALDMYW